MKKLIFVLAIVFVGFNASQAQSSSANSSSYTSALGVKVWDGGGISFKHFLNEKNAGELIGYFYKQGVRITGLYEIHSNIEGVEGLKWYIGPGAHVGFYGSEYGNGAFIGVDGVLGLDYKLGKAPLNFSIDWQPSIEFGSGRGFYAGWGGLGIRYTF